MIVCDRCLDRKPFLTRTYFTKQENSKNKKRFRQMFSVDIQLCDQCINDFLKTFGKFKIKFLKEGDEE